MARPPPAGARRRGRTPSPGSSKGSGARKGPDSPSGGEGRPPREPRKPTVAGWQSRLAAADILFQVTDEEVDLDTALEQSDPYARLSPSDRGFARAIASSALRGLGRIDWALGGLLDRPLEEIEPALRALLRTGVAQLWLLKAPDYAAVSATVEAARRWPPARRGGGLLNAVLRRASREPELFETAPPTSVWPHWLAGRMRAALGTERADELARQQLDEPTLDLSLKRPETAAAWAEQLDGEATEAGSVRLKAGVRLAELPGYAEGEWWVQDAGAALAVRLLAPKAGETVLDLCAAPGGKALQIACSGARLIALDVSSQRLAVLTENARRVGAEMTIVAADARDWRPDAPVDAILLDAPCSAMGVLRRLPEAAWRRDPATLGRYPKLQADLLRSAFAMLKPGGRLVYCVCTPFPEEGAAVVAAALEQGWARLPVRAEEIPGFAHALTPAGDVLTAPQPGAKDSGETVRSDVFFLARLEKAPPPVQKP
jgi:16S rRNA (cytosine967-C5)-methyltransferase